MDYPQRYQFSGRQVDESVRRAAEGEVWRLFGVGS